jgi:hypothetical protein
VFFALATVTRSMMATYLGVVALFVAYLVGSSFLGRPELREIGALLDPFGLTATARKPSTGPRPRATRETPAWPATSSPTGRW